MEYTSGEAFFLLTLRHLHFSPQARRAGPLRDQRVLSRGFRPQLGAGARDRGDRNVGGRSECAEPVARAARDRAIARHIASNAQTKTPPPLAHICAGETAFLLFMTRKEEISLSLAGLAATYSPRA